MTTDASSPSRAHWVGAPEFFNLNHACCALHKAFPQSLGIYLVGSATQKRDYRDVDVRCILTDEDFHKLFPELKDSGNYSLCGFWSILCASISLWLQRQTGLPIDFQVQRQSDANRDYPMKGHPRNALGYFYAPGA
jgi:hypothetical protein